MKRLQIAVYFFFFVLDLFVTVNDTSATLSKNVLRILSVGRLVVFRFNGTFRQYFSLYRAVSQRKRAREEKRWRRVKMSKQHPPAPTASTIGPCPTIIQIVRRPGTRSLPRTIAPPDQPPF